MPVKIRVLTGDCFLFSQAGDVYFAEGPDSDGDYYVDEKYNDIPCGVYALKSLQDVDWELVTEDEVIDLSGASQSIVADPDAPLLEPEAKHNPKHIQAQKEGKAPLDNLVWSVLEDDAYVHAHGAEKYGPRNWRIDHILASTYEGAIMRHFLAWAQGEDVDPDSGRPHLSHVRACCAIVMDAQQHESLIDDRNRQESRS